ncbi:protein disabled [Teleopsis dalmanni]|uniref:protein disabled n=1 Tax=Teleopsis dalmanni TaxID=139649 RepID=UPI0018CDD968|nr:protein disabled [Teleopsis dalmanni]
MVKSLVSKLSSASNLSLSSTLSSVGGGSSHGSGTYDTNYFKHRNDPGRFFGDGVQFKAKLIGILEVGEARGDRMCQEALQDLKMAIRAAGEHKQRITIHVTIDGLRLRDEKTGDSLYHHPVHKISFIAQDMTDSRAFGYIFGSPDSGHRFFGIKTDKAASQVVLAMRDLFQVVFELKKKEIELARQQIQSKTLHEHQRASLASLKPVGGHNDLSGSVGSSTMAMFGGISGQGATGISRLGVNLDSKDVSKEMSPESVADLVDLEQELSSIQRGITQMERITPSDPVHPPMCNTTGKSTNDEDPFGDSFTNFPTYNILPPPESDRSRNKPGKPPDANATTVQNPALSSLLSPTPAADSSATATLAQQEDEDNWLNDLDQQNDVFDTSKTVVMGMGVNLPMAPLAPSETIETPIQQFHEHSMSIENDVLANTGVGNSITHIATNTSTISAIDALASALNEHPNITAVAAKSDAFTDLDPLGTGRTRPYVDKKYFFQELKNPPKKVLKDLSANNSAANTQIYGDITASNYSAAAAVVDEFLSKEGLFDDTIGSGTLSDSTSRATEFERAQLQAQQLSKPLPINLINTNTYADPVPPTSTGTGADPVMLPRDTDPFSPTRKKSDPFQDGDIFTKLDPFEFEFSGKNENTNQRVSPSISSSAAASSSTTDARRPKDVFNGPLQVNLPPESGSASVGIVTWKSDISKLERPSSDAHSTGMGNNISTVRSRPTISGSSSHSSSGIHAPSSMLKQQTVDVISSISNKKMPHLFGQARFSKRGDSNSINMRRLQESDSLSENETAPEPPPRPDAISHVEPPPLPPKKQFNDIVIRPRITSGNAVPPVNSSNRYEYIISTAKLSAPAGSVSTGVADVPPIPLPSRRVGRSDGTYPGPGRPRKPGHTEDDYLAPIGLSTASNSNMPGSSDVPPLLPPPVQISTRTRAQRQQSQTKAQDIYENKKEILQQQQEMQMEEAAASAAVIPDITLSQLLTLGIDELAIKLNVPTSKLSTMTLVELTTYLSEFIEKSKPSNTSMHMQQPHSISPVLVNANQNDQNFDQAPVFKVNFDQQATFVAKFDDTFGEDMPTSNQNQNQNAQEFVANFAQFNNAPIAPPIPSNSTRVPAVPPADRYAVFREIIDQELQQCEQNANLIGDLTPPEEETMIVDSVHMDESTRMQDVNTGFDAHFEDDDFLAIQTGQQSTLPKFDTKITEVVAQAKDRYAALRDIILVENLFDQKPVIEDNENNLMQEFTEFSEDFNEDQDLKQIMDERVCSTGPDRLGLVDSRGFPAEPSSSALTVEDDEDEDGGAESSLDSNDKDAERNRGDLCGLPQDQYEKLSTSTQQLDVERSDKIETGSIGDVSSINSNLPNSKQDSKFLMVAGTSGLSSSKDDLEIDELMQRAISNLSLDSRERISPANSTSATGANTTISISVTRASCLTTQSQFNDVSTSPIPLQKSPVPGIVQQKSPVSKSTQPSPILSQLSAVSNLIDTATKQIKSTDVPLNNVSKKNKESWATFDSPKPVFPVDIRDKRGRIIQSGKSTSLHLPPAPPSNTSQNDTAESPCSSDPREEGWNKGSVNVGRRWTKKDRQQTSSSSRDLSPWDDEAPDFQKQKRHPMPQMPAGQTHVQPDRHGYYMRHARRMNSCDEDYDYEDDFNNRRDQRKFKHGLSRSRDNFDLDSPSWYHHSQHHTWSPQDIDQASNSRIRGFERAAYERSTYGPPIYDKRGMPMPATVSSYDRRSGYDKRKYYRDYARPNYEFEEYADSSTIQERYRDGGSFEKLKVGRRSDYENVYDDGRLPTNYKTRTTEYMYERDRKSFDRESVESYESATRRRRSFGSGDVYGSLESREDFRDRYMGGAERTRSLRKGMKLRATGDIEYEDSESDLHQRARGAPVDTRSLQRPSQLAASSGGVVSSSQARMRKSSGSSPWDGEDPPLPGQKPWKRPSSAADNERRLVENRRATALGHTPSGSDGEKDRRFRKKQRQRAKDLSSNNANITTGGRYGNPAGVHTRDNYDYITYDNDNDDEDDVDDDDYGDEEYDDQPTDEDKFERLNRRRHEMHQRMLESERRQHALSKPGFKPNTSVSNSSAPKKYHTRDGRSEYTFDDFEQTPTPRSNASASGGSAYPVSGSCTKFSFDGGFESDFNQSSPPPAPAGTASSCNSTPAGTGSATTTPATKSSFRFSNDFSEREKLAFAQNSTSVSSLQQFDLDTGSSPVSRATPPSTQKLRFDDNVKISQFDDAAFEDDFSKAQFDFEKEDQWHADSLQSTSNAATKKHNLRNSKLQQRQELIKKSESINIFAKKAEDPFEDDEFFKAPTTETKTSDNGINKNNTTNIGNNFQWDDDNNFAKFDENM